MFLHEIRFKAKKKDKKFKYLKDDKEILMIEKMYTKTPIEHLGLMILAGIFIVLSEMYKSSNMEFISALLLVLCMISVIMVLWRYLDRIVECKECNVGKGYLSWIFIKRIYKIMLVYLYANSFSMFYFDKGFSRLLGLDWYQMFYLASILTMCGLFNTLVINKARNKMIEGYFSNISDGLKKGQLEIAKESLKSEEDMRMIWGEGYYIIYRQMSVLIEEIERVAKEEEISLVDRTELITNASHDIRTPLTSIINYIDILKRSDISDKERRDFIEVLENKVERLKTLVEDLKYATDFSIGDVECNLDGYDVVELINNAIDNNKDSLSKFNVEKEFEEERHLCLVDKNNTLRVFDNLISNISKYSLEGSRVYISVANSKINKKSTVITFKNISRESLNIPVIELMKRFKRGDISRNTKGNGLGLDIAKNLVKLQKGSFDISIEGDLFKVEITLNNNG